MQTTHHPRSASTIKGFTLIEILVVIVIISIGVGVVAVNFSAGSLEQKAEEEADRLQQLLRFAHQQSVVRAEEYGIRFYTTGYRFMQYDELSQQWADIQKDRLLRNRALIEPLEINLYIDQLSVDIPDSPSDDPQVEKEDDKDAEEQTTVVAKTQSFTSQATDKIRPQVFLLSSGELSPAFELHIRVPGTEINEQLNGLPQGEYTRGIIEE